MEAEVTAGVITSFISGVFDALPDCADWWLEEFRDVWWPMLEKISAGAKAGHGRLSKEDNSYSLGVLLGQDYLEHGSP